MLNLLRGQCLEAKYSGGRYERITLRLISVKHVMIKWTGSCSMADFGISGVEPSYSATRGMTPKNEYCRHAPCTDVVVFILSTL
jgi:hypothetical protein